MHDPLDELIEKARVNPTFEARQALIDAEIDGTGRWVGYDAACWYWSHAIVSRDSCVIHN